MARKLSKELFIKESQQIHGNKYNYSLVEYKNLTTKVKIICPIHGIFEQTPYHHLERKGCAKCIGRNKTTEDFIKEAQYVHGNKYDYSKSEYKGAKTKVCIICPKHGEFWQLPNNHVNQKQGCPLCNGGRKLTTKEFVKKAKEIHGDKYDYSKVEYINNHTKVCIICHEKDENGIEHGEFWQTPNDHLDKHGCPKCKAIKIGNLKRNNLEDLKTKISNNISILSDEYINNKTKVLCKCKKCGYEWKIRPDLLIRGTECPKCNQSKGEQNLRKYLELNNIKYINQYKIQIDKSINSSGIARVDFYLPDYNTFIEYNGIQHYIPIEYFGGKFRFEKQKERDQFIRNFCNENNINLLEIRYDENIEEKLDEYFNKQVLIK